MEGSEEIQTLKDSLIDGDAPVKSLKLRETFVVKNKLALCLLVFLTLLSQKKKWN